jgi:hypothetical protein
VSVLSGLDPNVRPWAEWFVSALRAAGYNPIITSVRRSRATQERLYRDYLAGRNPYPVAVPGTSRHERGLAWDMVVENPEYVGGIWNTVAPNVFKWGGRADPVHFEFRI